MEEMKRNCELCNGEALLYCPSDNAFLCYTCDSKVHCANFLVARHVRSSICPRCRNLNGNRFSGTGIPPVTSTTSFCRNCSPEMENGKDDANNDDGEDSLSSCSSCVSSTGEEAETSSTMRKTKEKGGGGGGPRRSTVVVDLKVEGVLVNWCKKIGIEQEENIGKVVKMAVELLSGCLDRITVLPFRVMLAASFWVALRVCCRGGGDRCSSNTCQDLKRVEQISGVPAKLILATEARLARVIRRRRSRENYEEGWAEC